MEVRPAGAGGRGQHKYTVGMYSDSTVPGTEQVFHQYSPNNSDFQFSSTMDGPGLRIPVGPYVAWTGPEQTCDRLASVFSTACLPSGVLSCPVEVSLPFQGMRSCSLLHLARSLIPHLRRFFHSRPLHLFPPSALAPLGSLVLCQMIIGKSCALEGALAQVLTGNELWPCLRGGVRKRARVHG